MAIARNRDHATPAPDVADLEARLERAEQIIALMMRVMARAAIRYAPGSGQSTFTRILTDELRAASHDEAAAIEAWMTAHHGA